MIWRSVPGYEGLYEVSNTGLIRNRKTFRILRMMVNWDGALKVNLSNNGTQKTHIVHQIVAEVFVPKVEGCKFVKHSDSNKANNAADNLYWSRTRQKIKEAVV